MYRASILCTEINVDGKVGNRDLNLIAPGPFKDLHCVGEEKMPKCLLVLFPLRST
jgi:hypothetical protein